MDAARVRPLAAFALVAVLCALVLTIRTNGPSARLHLRLPRAAPAQSRVVLGSVLDGRPESSPDSDARPLAETAADGSDLLRAEPAMSNTDHADARGPRAQAIGAHHTAVSSAAAVPTDDSAAASASASSSAGAATAAPAPAEDTATDTAAHTAADTAADATTDTTQEITVSVSTAHASATVQVAVSASAPMVHVALAGPLTSTPAAQQPDQQHGTHRWHDPSRRHPRTCWAHRRPPPPPTN